MSEQSNPNEVVLRVKTTADVKKLSSAILHELEKCQGTSKVVVVRAIGVMAVNQAVKAIARAGGGAGQRGKFINSRIGFSNVSVEDSAHEKEDKVISCIAIYCTLA